MEHILYVWRPVFEILILWFIIYHIMLFFEGTRALFVVRGIVILLVAFFLFQKLGFQVLDWIMTKLFAISIIAALILFHPEIRQGLARLGQRHIFSPSLKKEEIDYVLSLITRATEHLCRDKIGALIAIENNEPLTAYVESGILVDSRISAEIVETIFTPHSLLHDGGIVIQHGRISAAGCIFPLSQKQELSRIYGTRHRAALGLSEETDALIIVISEERQDISLVYKGGIEKNLDREALLARCIEIMNPRKKKNEEETKA